MQSSSSAVNPLEERVTELEKLVHSQSAVIRDLYSRLYGQECPDFVQESPPTKRPKQDCQMNGKSWNGSGSLNNDWRSNSAAANGTFPPGKQLTPTGSGRGTGVQEGSHHTPSSGPGSAILPPPPSTRRKGSSSTSVNSSGGGAATKKQIHNPNILPPPVSNKKRNRADTTSEDALLVDTINSLVQASNGHLGDESSPGEQGSSASEEDEAVREDIEGALELLQVTAECREVILMNPGAWTYLLKELNEGGKLGELCKKRDEDWDVSEDLHQLMWQWLEMQDEL